MTIIAIPLSDNVIFAGSFAIAGYLLLLYLGIYHKKSQLPYLGGYFALWITVIEIMFIPCDVTPTSNDISIWAMSIPWVCMAALSQAWINWKIKTAFFVASRTMPIIKYYIEFGKAYLKITAHIGYVSSAYILMISLVIIFACLTMYD